MAEKWDIASDNKREYETTHPWLTFEADLSPASRTLWIALGEAQSKCEHIAGVPLRPDIAAELHKIFLAKGVLATTAIEGNTLTEEDVRAQIDGKLKLPPSQAYLKQEIVNIIDAAHEILTAIEEEDAQPVTVETVKHYNRLVLKKLKLDEGVIPGRIRTHSVGVGNYRCAPWGDCEYLLQRLCNWLNGLDFQPKAGFEIVTAIAKSIVSHIYFVWIHPFGDGNGRTARLLEFRFLLEAGVPSAAAHLLSNHYNLTRSEYYRQLDLASKSGGDIIPFLEYAARGFVDQLKEQLELIRHQQWQTTWVNYVHETFGDRKSQAERRQLRLALALSWAEKPVDRRQLRRLTPELAEEYAGKTSKTLTRDINSLRRLDLIAREKGRYRARMEKILAFLPRGKLIPPLQELPNDEEAHSAHEDDQLRLI